MSEYSGKFNSKLAGSCVGLILAGIFSGSVSAAPSPYAETVIINGKGAHRLNDADQHCGGVGKMVQASPNVYSGG